MAFKLRRRREGKTDYQARLSMIRANAIRIIVRKTNRYMIAQAVENKETKDFTICFANSKELISKGWNEKQNGSLKSIPAAYLTGILLGNKIKKLNLKKKFILDAGIIESTKGSRVYAVVKGLIDLGINVPCSEEVIPSMERMQGQHMKKKPDIEAFKNKISGKQQ